MPRLRLTKREVEKLPAPDPSGKQILYWDAELKGFGVLVSGKTATKTYVVQHKLTGGLTRRVTIGPVAALDLDGARARARTVISTIYAGKDPKTERREATRRTKTLRAALDDYLTGRKALSPKSIAGYRGAVETYLKEWLDRALREITPEMVEKRHGEIAVEVKKRAAASMKETERGDRRGGGPTTGAATANGTMRALRAIWYWAAERDPALPPNPVRRLKRGWFPEPRRERLVTDDQLPAFYAAVDELPSRTAADYIKVLLFTGLRRGEAAALRWSEVDLSARLIRLPAARTKARRKLDLPISDFVADLLIARRAIGDDGGWVFGADSKSEHIEEPKFALGQVAKSTGIRITPHDLRRSYITVAEAADISPMALKALVNHALGGDVTSGYIQMTVERLREPAQRVCDRLRQLCGIAAVTDDRVAPLRGGA